MAQVGRERATEMFRWRKAKERAGETPLDGPSRIDPLASRENAETFGIAYGVGQALGMDPVLTGSAALYVKAEQEAREQEANAAKLRRAGGLPPGAQQAGG